MNKILIIICILIVGGIGFIIYNQHQMSIRQDAIEKNIILQKELADNILRSMSQYSTKEDLEKFAKDSNINLQVIKSDLDKLNATVTAINVSKAHSSGQSHTDLPSTNTQENPNPTDNDQFGYLKRKQILSINEKFDIEVPIGEVGFSAWKEKPWSIDIKAREYNAITVIGTDENQRMYAYNKFFIKIDSKNYEVKLVNGEIKQIFPEPKFTLWNPRLYLGVDGGTTSNLSPLVSPSINLQLASYGRYKSQPDISIAQIGAAYDMVNKNPSIMISPISYNIGKHLPLMNNLYFGPFIGGNQAGLNAGVGLHVGL